MSNCAAVTIPLVDDTILAPLAYSPFDTVSLVAEVVANVLVPVTFKVLVAVIFPTIRLDPVALSKNREANTEDSDLNISVKNVVVVAADPEALINDNLAKVAEAEVRSVMVVVARVDVPLTVKLPLAVVEPIPARNDTFSTQLDPFQYIVDDVAVPEAKAPPLATLIHLVDVPVLDNT